ncbi:C40 family peptidase [Halostreptopolyspora alba]|uniref:NlpC/P60 family protein n=1 Tax=Halostreptopolyspora alba TaxID=2487137 RepID=A0A3N0E9F5_9ACTN|nr:NlpC/P60 family protein [Nocardiopsaceae bacterium YIM 96095]
MAAVTVLGLVTAAPVAAEERVRQESGVAVDAAEHAKKQVGKPYRYGGSGPGSFDCSGLVQWSYKQAGKSLSRTTYGQVAEGRAVKRSNLEKGDLVFFYSGPGHVGIYLGDGTMVHSPKPGRAVEVVNMSGYWDNNFSGARRVA